MEIRKGMPGLKQAGKLANNHIKYHLSNHGYAPIPGTPSLWKHVNRDITFYLVVDDFGVQYVGHENAEHLLCSLQELYTVTIDWTCSLYCGINIMWNYSSRSVDISMPGYIKKLLQKFQQSPPSRRQNVPRPWNVPVYGQKVQYATDNDGSPFLPKKVSRSSNRSYAASFITPLPLIRPCSLPLSTSLPNKLMQPEKSTTNASGF